MATHFCPQCVAKDERIKDLESALQAILAEHKQLSYEGEGWVYCILCSPQEGRYPCVTALLARDALGDGEAKP